jgi:hypothetical protein
VRTVLRRPLGTQDDSFAGLAALWLDGLAQAHDPGCGCGGLYAPALQAQEIEDDLTDYLLVRYRQLDMKALVAVVEGRKAEARHQPFEGWIRGLAARGLSFVESQVIEGDLRTFLESLAAPARRAIGICI